MKKRTIILVSLIAILMLLVGCTTPKPAETTAPDVEEKRLKITYIVPAIAHPTFLIAKEAFEKAAVDYNFEPIWAGSTLPDANEMVKQIEIAIASKVDGLIIMAAVPDAMRPAIQAAYDAGIPVVTVIADCKDVDKLAYLGLNNQNYGKIAAEKALEGLAGKKPKIAVMVPTFENQSGIEIIASLKENFAAAGDYDWLITVESKSDMVTAVSVWEDVFTTYPEVNTIFSIGSEGGPAAAKVMKEMGLTIDDVLNIGISDIAETLDAIREGYIYASMSENIPRIGYQPAEWIVNYIRNGVKPNPINDTGTFAITKDNVDTYPEIENDKSLWK
ncbi:MAG: substrate-binding domain-containing protein [Anaerolineaceae bacterium]|nr:substrate-binding domain-containing protein [Anaerolineaceae bacterium]